MMLEALIIVGIGLSCFPEFTAKELPFLADEQDVAIETDGEKTPLSLEDAKRIGEISTFTLSLLDGDLEAWRSAETKTKLKELLEYKDLTPIGRDHLETIQVIISVLDGENGPDALAEWHWDLLHRTRGNISMMLIGHSLNLQLEEIALIDKNQRDTKQVELASELVDLFALLECQAASTELRRANAGIPFVNEQLGNWHQISEYFPDLFSPAIERLSCCLPEASAASRKFEGVLLADALKKESEELLTEEAARRYTRILPVDAFAQHRILNRALGTDYDSALYFVTNEWAPAVISVCEELDRPDLIQHFLNLMDCNLMFYRSTMVPEEMELLNSRYLSYYKLALESIVLYLDDFPEPPWQHDSRIVTVPNAIDIELFRSLCATPLKRLEYFSATREGQVEVASQLADLEVTANEVVNRMREGKYDTARFFIGTSLIRQQQLQRE